MTRKLTEILGLLIICSVVIASIILISDHSTASAATPHGTSAPALVQPAPSR